VVPSWKNTPGHIMGPQWDVKAVGDFNGDGYADIAWRRDDATCLGNPCSHIVVWWMVGSVYTAESPPQGAGRATQIAGVGDLDGDGRADLFFRRADGGLVSWFGGSDQEEGFPTFSDRPGPEWQIAGLSDFNRDGRSDILWQRTDGTHVIWMMSAAAAAGTLSLSETRTHVIDTSWQVQGLLPR
jgi:hypothetical protein